MADRSIPIRLERRARGEAVERFRYREAKERAEPIRAALAEALEELTARLAQSRPALPDSLGDRAADGWEPLLAVADAAGGKWPALAREAAIALSGETTNDLDEASLHVLLLADCRAAFDRTGADRLLTVNLIEELLTDEERPWREYGRNDRGITAHGVSRLLRGYGVRPVLVRLGTTVGRGYRRSDFESAWSRYLPPVAEPPIRYSVTNGPSEHESDVLTDPSCNGVAAVTLPTGWEGDPELPANDDGWPEMPAAKGGDR
ncbi:MAG: DUF3631 domain-containing protein [Chloroflexi bacterium]|nr:DUF3631 domain-containing protein [Chloroflexota bacterium]